MKSPTAAEARLPNFLPEDYVTLLRAAVTLAWAGVIGMALVRLGYHFAGWDWPALGGFDRAYLAILFEFTLTAACLSVLAVRRDWFERVPRDASSKLRALLTLVIVWLSLHHLAAFQLTGGARGPLLVALPLLLTASFLSLPRSGAWCVAALLLGGHAGVTLLEYNRWIPSPGQLAPAFALEDGVGGLVVLLVCGAAIGLGLLARGRFDEAGANVNRRSRVNHLTGLYEQDFLMQRLATELRRRRHGGRVTLLMIEFDGFPGYTATHGYDAGRAALRHAAQTLIRYTRHEMDTPARYAPTTFALLLPDARREQAGAIAARIGAALAELSDGALRARAGMACVTGSGELSPREVLAAASEALGSAQPDEPPAQVDLTGAAR
jgi:diguanylate cyclase (GGDEF)-like protein